MPDRAALFAAVAEQYDQIVPYFAEFGRRTVELAAPAAGARVLDVACGRGATVLPAARRVGPSGRVLGVDRAAPMVAALRRDLAVRQVANVAVATADAAALPAPAGGFDLALCGSALFLLPDPAAAAGELHRVLRPGGRVAVSVPRETDGGWPFLRPAFLRHWQAAGLPGTPWPTGRFDAAAVLSGAGFVETTATVVAASIRFGDPDTWWRWIHTMGWRAALDRLPPAARSALWADLAGPLAAQAGPDGLTGRYEMTVVLGRRG
ncbi:methyltransferase [Actinocatenispora thailandica]|uniref:Methyltransferase n=1 Tax=Actinocatenispora thailandica TaxID=227318 RepID=A0A7R7HX76_9ACTN|nr:methyltransferase domain-containing protein [Actinocatenispora thailandica]BCJ35436.1 methyltransferase [Actinocatenispora thailandica]